MERYGIYAYIAFLIISTTGLLPWNLFMNAHQYFHYKLRNVSIEVLNGSFLYETKAMTDLQRSYEGWVTITSGATCIFGSVLNFLTTNSLSNTARVISGHLTVLVALLPTVGLTFLQTESVQQAFFWISMFLASLASFGSAGLIACGLLGHAARFPAQFVEAVMVGQSLAGILSSLLSIACQAFTSNPLLNGRLFFTIATVWTAFSIALYVWLVNSAGVNSLQQTVHPAQSSGAQVHQPLLHSDDDSENSFSDLDSDDSLHLPATMDDSFMKGSALVWSEAWMEITAAFTVLFGTLSAFPALSSLVVSVSTNTIWRDYFSSVACFLLFNTGDAAGRLLSGYASLGGRTLFLCSLLRMLFVPLFFFCNIEPRLHSSSLFVSDGFFIIMMGIFAVSNGFLFTNSTVSATRKANTNLRELAGSLLGLVAVVSSFLGSVIGILIVSMV